MSGTELIAAERMRQINEEGWTPEHDTHHTGDDLALAAACYATPARCRAGISVPPLWPWRREEWKPEPDDRVRELVKAGALIAAEIDRLLAVVPNGAGPTSPLCDCLNPMCSHRSAPTRGHRP